MKYKVLKDFIDKETSVKHEAGSEYEANTSRGKELIDLGYLEKAVKKTVKKDEFE